MAHADHTRDPCPWVILNDFGGAFAMGSIGGGIWYGIKGARNAPRGDRIIAGLSSIKARAPVTGGNFGIWGGCFSTFDCAIKGVRQKEDAWNAILSGFHDCCGILLGVFEGVGVLIGRVFAAGPPSMAPCAYFYRLPSKSS
ncbi:mitochondrial import inner membrane translocase subunit [Rhodocollybia butyracea]|uniref:Mitochondrial import inner membrane translocase subunit n=1 Tax=Rhodocollybia butyracea TaxID=206335 RepID=A0A9P5PYL7_9AGAR|nr:mitochondrial import inner membrane translocase subunit [Rhodocollybia butyracea]